MSHHIRTEVTSTIIVQSLQEQASLSEWLDDHQELVQEEDPIGEDQPWGTAVYCTEWTSGGMEFKVTSPTSGGLAEHRAAVAAAKNIWPED